VAGPFAGTVKEVKIMASGDNEGVAWVKDMTIREEQRSYETNFWMLPNKQIFGSTPLITIN
jgi:hypothetical protein